MYENSQDKMENDIIDSASSRKKTYKKLIAGPSSNESVFEKILKREDWSYRNVLKFKYHIRLFYDFLIQTLK